jgi:hypothetical protein
MKESRSCDPELFRKVKEAVSMRQAVDFCGIQVNAKGLCLCPFHKDRNPSLKIYSDGKGFFCFTCGAGGDQIKFVAKYHDINNYEAAKRLAAAFSVPIEEPVSYREKREAEQAQKKRRELNNFKKQANLWMRMYRILLCEARRDLKSPHFYEGIQNLEYVSYLIDCLEQCPEKVYADKKVVSEIERVKQRVLDWHSRGTAVPG